jgi:serine acetyltransferase
MKTWFESTSSVKKRKQRETIAWLLLILVFAWLVVASLKVYLNSQKKESVASLQTSQLSLMRSFVYKNHAKKSDAHNNDHAAYSDYSIHINENANIADERALLHDTGSSLNEKQKILQATRMHNVLRTLQKND